MDSKRKTQIVNDWQQLLPGSKKYTPNKLYSRAGPVIYGLIFYFSESDYASNYTVYFRMYILSPNPFKREFKKTFNDAVAQYQFCAHKDLQLNVSIARHEEEFAKDKDFFLSQVFVPFSGSLKMSDIERCFHYYLETERLTFMDIRILEFYFALYQYMNLDRSIVVGTLKKLEAIMNAWDEKTRTFFQSVYRISASAYLQSFYNELDHPEEKLAVMQEWMSNPKVKKLTNLELVYDL